MTGLPLGAMAMEVNQPKTSMMLGVWVPEQSGVLQARISKLSLV